MFNRMVHTLRGMVLYSRFVFVKFCLLNFGFVFYLSCASKLWRLKQLAIPIHMDLIKDLKKVLALDQS